MIEAISCRSIQELRLVVTEHYFCGGRPCLFATFGEEFLKYWQKLNARSIQGMTRDEWEAWMKGGESLDARKCLSEEEYNSLLQEAYALKIEVFSE